MQDHPEDKLKDNSLDKDSEGDLKVSLSFEIPVLNFFIVIIYYYQHKSY